MTKKEINSLNQLLTQEINTYCVTKFEQVKDRIRGYKNVYSVLNSTIEYHYITNIIALKDIELDFYNREYLKDLLEMFKERNIEIPVNLINDDLSILLDVLIDEYQKLKISNEDKIKVTKKLNSMYI